MSLHRSIDELARAWRELLDAMRPVFAPLLDWLEPRLAPYERALELSAAFVWALLVATWITYMLLILVRGVCA